MSSATEYQSVPTTTTTSGRLRRRSMSPTFKTIIMLCIVFGAPLIIFGILQYININKFGTEPGSCRVNGYASYRDIGTMDSGVRPVWYVDIVKQSPSSSLTNDVVILRSNLKIIGSEEHRFAPSALEEARILYKVDKIYPCYHHRQFLDNNTDDSRNIKFKKAVQWEKPSRTKAVVLLSLGSILTLIPIICVIIAIVVHIRG